MSYYDTIDEDLKRAREILKEGAAESVRPELLQEIGPELAAKLKDLAGGTIYGKDIYVAYKLLESLVAEVERLQQQIRDIQSARTVFGDVKGYDLEAILGSS